MFNLKQWGIAAAISLVAAGAMASNFRAADQVYLPIAGHVAGSSGTFVSDVFLSNLSTTDSVDVTIIFSSQGAGGTQNNNFNTITLAPNQRKEFIDFFGPANLNLGNQLGQVIFNACLHNADCGTSTQDSNGFSPNFRNISVESRIYSGSNGTTGQDVSGYPWYNFVSSDQATNGLDKVFITGVRNTTAYRTNIGYVNASQYSTTTIKITLFDGNGTPIGSPFTDRLAPLGNALRSIGSMFPAFAQAASSTNAWVQVEQTDNSPTTDAPLSCQPNGCPAFFAYGSSLDNTTNDPTTLEAQYFKPLSDAAILQIYPSGSGKTTMRRAVHH